MEKKKTIDMFESDKMKELRKQSEKEGVTRAPSEEETPYPKENESKE